MIDKIFAFIFGIILTMLLFPCCFKSPAGIITGAVGFMVIGSLYKCLFDIIIYGEVKQ